MSYVLDVYSIDRSTFHGTVTEPHDGFAWSSTLDGGGGGRVVVDAAHADAALLDDGRLVVVRDDTYALGVAAGEVAAWIVEEYGETVGDAWVADSINGPEVFTILETSCVEPEGGVGSRTTDKRWFGPMSALYDDSAWEEAWSHGTVHHPVLSQMPSPHRAEFATAPHANGVPEDFPDGDAEKLWDGANVDAAGDSPAGWVHFRREFFLEEGFEGELYATSDNLSSMFLDGIPVISVDNPRGWERTFAEQISLDAGWHVIYARVFNIANGNPAHWLFSMMGFTSSRTPIVRRSHTWVDHPEPVLMYPYPPLPPGMTLGEIFDILLDEAQARGELAGVTWTFDADVDSAGVPWPDEFEIAFSIGSTLAKVAAELGELGAEIDVTPDLEVRAYVHRGTDRSGAVDLTADGVAIDEPRLQRRARIRTRFLLRLEGTYAETEDPVAIADHGVRTEFLSLGGFPQGPGAADYLADVVAERVAPTLDTNLEIDPAVVAPYVAAGGAFDLGDDVNAPAHRLPAGTPMRILSLGVEVDAGGVSRVALDLGA